MKVENNVTVKFVLASLLLAANVNPATASAPTPHIYNRGVHGHIDWKYAEDGIVPCPGLEFSQLYLGNTRAVDQYFLQSGVVPGGRYGREDRRSLERCLRQNHQ